MRTWWEVRNFASQKFRLTPVRSSHGTRVRFSVQVSCSAELAVHSCTLHCLQAYA